MMCRVVLLNFILSTSHLLHVCIQITPMECWIWALLTPDASYEETTNHSREDTTWSLRAHSRCQTMRGHWHYGLESAKWLIAAQMAVDNTHKIVIIVVRKITHSTRHTVWNQIIFQEFRTKVVPSFYFNHWIIFFHQSEYNSFFIPYFFQSKC
jgi:hypothetical protein